MSLESTLSGIITSLRNKKVIAEQKVKPVDLAATIDARNIAVTQLDGITDDKTVLYHNDGRVDVLDCGQVQCRGDDTLSAIRLGSKVMDLLPMSFANCSSLQKVEFDENLSAIWGASNFQDCVSLKEVKLPENLAYFGYLGNNSFGKNFYTFQGCTSLSSVYLGSKITSIPERTFAYCKSLPYIRIPATVTDIATKAFGCDSTDDNMKLSGVEFEEDSHLTSIGQSVFDCCVNLSTISLPPNLIQIRGGAFWKCTSLISLDFQEKFEKIPDANTFGGCSSLSTIVLRNKTDVVTLGSVDAFNGTYSKYVVCVPDDMLDSYLTATNWSDLTADGHISSFSQVGIQ